MITLAVETIRDLSPERLQSIVKRSAVDVSAVLDDIRKIVHDVREFGDRIALEYHRQFKAEISSADLLAGPEEIAAAYESLDPKLMAALKLAAANIEKFHKAQLDREMWAIEVQPGVLCGRYGQKPILLYTRAHLPLSPWRRLLEITPVGDA